MLTSDEKNLLHLMMLEDIEAEHRAKIILLKDKGDTVLKIRRAINRHDVNIRKWIHYRFNEKGIDGILSKKQSHKQHYKFGIYVEKKIVYISSSNLRGDYGLGFSTWSLRVLAGLLCIPKNGRDKISIHLEIRNILLKHKTK